MTHSAKCSEGALFRPEFSEVSRDYCLAVAATPAPLPTFLRIVALVPATVAPLIGD